MNKRAIFYLKILILSVLMVIISISTAYAVATLLMQTTPSVAVSDLEVADYDGDALGEVITAGPDRRIYMYENNGALVYTSNQLAGTVFRQLLSSPPQIGSPHYGLLITDTRRALFNIQTKAVAPLWTNTVAAGWVYLTPSDVGDLNADGLYDLVNGMYRSATNVFRVQVVRIVNGTQIAETGNIAGNLDAILLKNFGNSIYDRIVFSSNAPRLYIYNYNPGTGGIAQAASVALGQRYTFLDVVSDVNNDGVKDIACATYITAGNNGVDVRSGTNGTLIAQLRVAGAGTPVSMATADFDMDGVTEVAIGTGGTDSRIRIFKARNPVLLVYTSQAFSGNVYVRSGDFDYDGYADLVAANGSNVMLIKYNRDTNQYYISETTSSISGSIDLFEKFKARQFNGGSADDVIWADATNSQLKAITFYVPPRKVVQVYNEKVLNTEVSNGTNFLLDKLYFSANSDGVLNSIRYSYSGSLNPAYLTSLKVFKDDGNGRFEPDRDTLVGQTTIQFNQAIFNLNLNFQSDTLNLLYLAADVRDDVPSGYNFKFSIAQPSDFISQTFETTGTFPIETPLFLTIDKTVPVVFIQPSMTTPDGTNGWYRSPINISLSMNKLGIIYYRWNDDEEFKIYNGQLVPPIGTNTLYCYAVDLYGNRSTTKTLSLKIDLTPPEKVAGFQAEQTGASKITLVWRPSLDKEPGSGVASYEIFRNGKLLAAVSSSQTSYEDFDVKPLSKYVYSVRAVDGAGNKGAFSEKVIVKTRPAPVEITGFKVIEETKRNVVLWQPVESTEAGYIEVYRSLPDRAYSFSKISTVPLEPDAGIFVDELSDVELGHTYYYKLVLYNLQVDRVFETKPACSSMVSAEKKIGSSGGVFETPSGKVKLAVPPNSLSNEVTLTIKTAVTSYPASIYPLSEIYEFGPNGLSFSEPATLTLGFRTNRNLKTDLVKVGYYDGNTWTFLRPDIVDVSAGKASIKVDHFSLFGVFYMSSEVDVDPPRIEYAKGVSPSKVFVRFSEFISNLSLSSAFVEVSETSVTTFYPFKDGRTIVIETKYMDPSSTYYLYVSGIEDLSGNRILEDGVSNVASFTVSPTPHGKYLDDTDKCSLCHSVHYGKSKQLLLKETATEVCYLCHDSNGSGSKYATQSWFEDPDAVSIHHTRYGDSNVYCTDCHSPHRDADAVPSLLRVTISEATQTTQPAERFCFKCHGTLETTLPVHLRIKEASYTAGIHYLTLPGPSSGNGITCMQCHLPHASVQPSLMRGGTEESACITCHKASGVSPESGISINAPDVLTSLLTAPEATSNLPGFPSGRIIWYKHPVIEYSGRHTLLELFDATLAAQSQATTETRHAECEDCHNSHYAKQTIYRVPPLVPDSVLGAAGVKVFYPDETTVPVFVWEPYGSVSYEYEVCLRCHSSFAKAWSGDDLAKIFSPYNVSYHPVISIGKNQTTAINNSLKGLTSTSQILCSDCHYAADPTYPRGPHGSIYPFILAANYRFELKPSSTTDNYDSKDFELCYKCHSEEPFLDASGSSRPDTNFRYHGYHLRALYNNPGGNTVNGGILTPGAGQGNAICRECHYNQHGSDNPRLIKFSPNVLPTGSRTEPVFVPKTDNTPGYCQLVCHGRAHGVGMSY